MFAIQYAFQFLMIVVDRCGIVVDRCGIVVDRCGSLWIVVGHCGSFRVLVTTYHLMYTCTVYVCKLCLKNHWGYTAPMGVPPKVQPMFVSST